MAVMTGATSRGIGAGVPAAGAIAALGAAALIIASVGAFWPNAATPHLFPYQDKLEHVAAFAAISGLLSLLVERRWRLVVVTVLVGYAAVIEIVQGALLPGRQGDLGDFAAGAVGAVVAALIATALRAWACRPKTSPRRQPTASMHIAIAPMR